MTSIHSSLLYMCSFTPIGIIIKIKRQIKLGDEFPQKGIMHYTMYDYTKTVSHMVTIIEQ